MKTRAIFLMLTMANLAHANPLAPKYCSKEQLAELKNIKAEMEQNGAIKAFTDKGIGVAIGDCTTPYSLEILAKVPHKNEAQNPYCGLKLSLSYHKAVAHEQAQWILETVGNTYVSQTGVIVPYCTRIQK